MQNRSMLTTEQKPGGVERRLCQPSVFGNDLAISLGVDYDAANTAYSTNSRNAPLAQMPAVFDKTGRTTIATPIFAVAKQET